MTAIQFKDIWVMYRIKFIIDGKISWENFWALKAISFDIENGEVLGIIGENGAGKSTILKLTAGMLKPDRGEIKVSGRISGLLELGAGFQPELTGKENIYLNASLFGLTKSQIEQRYDEIVSFANIGKFINAPVKCYSQGMFVRLAFAIAIHVDPDILLIDDTLAVGDEHFQRKCIKKIFELKEQGKTIVCVTHDMNMLSRICKRTIFLKEGRIIKDDLIDKVIPLYTQMIGTREGVGILEKKPLSLIFNNGRLFLNWQDKLLAPDSGAYMGFLMANKWYSSLHADWEVRNEGENKLLATGKFYQLALTQIWRLELTDDYVIKWDIEIDSEEPLEMQEGFINIMLTNEYTQWFTTLEKGDFPLIDDKNKNWQTLLDGNVFRKCIGVEAKEISSNKIPSLAFEQFSYNAKTFSQILNTDYLSNCRVLQYKMLGLQKYSMAQPNHLNYFSGKITLNIPDIANYLKNVYDEFVLSRGKLRLIFDKGRVIIYYDGKILTKTNHIFTSIFANAKRHWSNLANWEVKKEKNNKLIAKGIWHELPVVQIWEIDVLDEFCFLWKVNLQVNNEINIEEQHARFVCCQDYKYWFSDYEKGEFPVSFLEADIDMLQRCVANGAVGIQSPDNQLPVLSLRFSKELNNFAKIFNSDFYNKARILQVDKVESEKDMRFLAGEYPCFKIEVFLDKDKQINIEDSNNILQKGKLKFIFDKGIGRIYWDGKELTKKLGLYTSLRSQGRWHDSSSQAIWRVESKDNDTIRALGKWQQLPINQCWEIRLKEDMLIEFNVKMKVEKEIEADRLQTNLMLSERYTQWMADKESGHFPLFKDDVDDDWDCIWPGGDSIKSIGVFESREQDIYLPQVIFSPKILNSDWLLHIINSDIYHRGRVLQYLNDRKLHILTGQYPYFSGKIIVKI